MSLKSGNYSLEPSLSLENTTLSEWNPQEPIAFKAKLTPELLKAFQQHVLTPSSIQLDFSARALMMNDLSFSFNAVDAVQVNLFYQQTSLGSPFVEHQQIGTSLDFSALPSSMPHIPPSQPITSSLSAQVSNTRGTSTTPLSSSPRAVARKQPTSKDVVEKQQPLKSDKNSTTISSSSSFSPSSSSSSSTTTTTTTSSSSSIMTTTPNNSTLNASSVKSTGTKKRTRAPTVAERRRAEAHKAELHQELLTLKHQLLRLHERYQYAKEIGDEQMLLWVAEDILEFSKQGQLIEEVSSKIQDFQS